MYHVLIAEDSKPILRNIQTLLGSLELPVRVAATAANGEEALETIGKQDIHLLLTDIRMPKMDGLALIEKAKQINPNLVVVLISGYNDFEYTRKALNLQVFDYLLKPVERSQLAEVMKRGIEHLERQARSDASVLKEIVDPSYHEKMQPGEHFHLYAKLMFVIRRQPFTNRLNAWNPDVAQRLLSGIFAPHACFVFPTPDSNQFLVLVSATVTGLFSSLYECMEAARRELHSGGMDVTIGGQLQAAEPVKLPELYYRLTELLNEQQLINRGCVLLDRGQPTTISGSGHIHTDPSLTTGFAEMIRGRRKEQFKLKLTEQLAKWAEGNARLAELESFVRMLIDTFARLLQDRDAEIRIRLEEVSNRLFDHETYAGFEKALLEWSDQCFEILQALSRKSGQELFGRLDEFLKKNMYSQLSINDVAQRFHVSPSYISRVIKKQTHNTFVQYYTKLKINEACRLMADKPDMKFKEISDALAFSDQHYFSKVFKEYTGYSPTEYKGSFQ
ncbi:response regulator transcription factor [Paenibacillus sp. DYY-L-2]|uniref:response regulator transcription factor n=1 Tax=Paenibacillus sp. DYY-L-2 TaxID=3447013 RepID=UPI003F507B4E